MEANHVVGQDEFTTGFVNFGVDPIFFGAREVSPDTLFVPGDLVYDNASERLFVADMHNHRFLVYEFQGGLTNGKSAAWVLGQPDMYTGGANDLAPYGALNTPNPAFGCAEGVNACGLTRAMSVEYDAANNRLFGVDLDNHRVMVWSLASMANGMPASFVIGQPGFTTGAYNAPCGGGTTKTPNACGLRDPLDVEFDPTSKWLFVVDSSNHRVLVYDLAAGIGNGMAASYVLGQPNFTTATAMTACGGGAAGTTNACGMKDPDSVSYDPVQKRLFVSDGGAQRVMVFDLSAGISNGMAASGVIGQPSLTSAGANRSCNGASVGATNTNACGLGDWGLHVVYDAGGGLLYVSDAANQRVVVFDAATVTDGEPAINVIGQPDFVSGYDPADPAFGGATSRAGMILPIGIAFDYTFDHLFVADGGNHRVLAYGPNVSGTPIKVSGQINGVDSTKNEDGSTTIDGKDAENRTYTVTLPAGTEPLPGEDDISVEYDMVKEQFWNAPRIKVDAKLPPGTTKSITLPRGPAVWVCVKDRSGAEFSLTKACPIKDTHKLPKPGVCEYRFAEGDPGDNPNDPSDPKGVHRIQICVSADDRYVTLNDLLHTVVEIMPMGAPPPKPGTPTGKGCEKNPAKPGCPQKPDTPSRPAASRGAGSLSPHADHAAPVQSFHALPASVTVGGTVSLR